MTIHSSAVNCFLAHLDLIDESNASGTLEFTIPGDDPDSFFPLSIGFYSPKLFVDLEVMGVQSDGPRRPGWERTRVRGVLGLSPWLLHQLRSRAGEAASHSTPSASCRHPAEGAL